MAMPVSRSNWTVDMLDELPDDGNKYELIDGELFVTPAPSDVHQLIVEVARPAYPYDLADVLLAVEVTSPCSATYEYQTRRSLYLKAIPEYWIIDPHAQTLARWRGAEDRGDLFAGTVTWQPDGMSSPFALDLREFFEDALG